MIVSWKKIGLLVLLGAAVFVDLPQKVSLSRFSFTRPPLNLQIGKSNFYRDLTVKQGLDLQGGTEVILEADMSQVDPQTKTTALEGVEEVIRRRVDLFGVSEPLIQRSQAQNSYRLIVQLPGVKDINAALNLIGQTAQLDFREEIGTPEETTASALLLANFIPTGLTGKDLRQAQVQFNSQSGSPEVTLQFTEEGTKKFAEITKRNIGKRVAIFLDNLPATIPVVKQEVADGNAVITGNFTTDEAKQLSIQLNAGALPVPVSIVQQRTVGATLGAASVAKSLQAGAVGLAIVMLFMITYYGRLGLIADIGLVLYAIITLAIYKLLPITVTLPGLAGFILSIGMAVDSNILVFERMKEEIRMGKPWKAAMELGFGRAWDSIKDANIATLMAVFILFNPLNWNFLPLSGMVRGFAITLGLGVLTSLFTGIVITRALLRTFYRGDNKTLNPKS